MASEVDICNMALNHIRGGQINSLTTDISLQAKTCKLHYDQARDEMLSSCDWNFAVKIQPLATTDIDVFNWVYAYAYPNDCLRITKLLLNFEEFSSTDGVYRTRHMEDIYTPNLEAQVKYEVLTQGGTKVIAANEPQLRARYRSRVEDSEQFPPMFVTALSYLLASRIAVPIVGGEAGRGLRSDAMSAYQMYYQNAATEDSNEQFFEPQESDLILVRQ